MRPGVIETEEQAARIMLVDRELQRIVVGFGVVVIACNVAPIRKRTETLNLGLSYTSGRD